MAHSFGVGNYFPQATQPAIHLTILECGIITILQAYVLINGTARVLSPAPPLLFTTQLKPMLYVVPSTQTLHSQRFNKPT